MQWRRSGYLSNCVRYAGGADWSDNPDGQSYASARANPDIDSTANRADAQSRGAFTHVDAHARPGAYGNPCPNARADSGAYSHRDTHTHTPAYSDAISHTDTGPNREQVNNGPA